jgi:hypothetical protein
MLTEELTSKRCGRNNRSRSNSKGYSSINSSSSSNSHRSNGHRAVRGSLQAQSDRGRKQQSSILK